MDCGLCDRSPLPMLRLTPRSLAASPVGSNLLAITCLPGLVVDRPCAVIHALIVGRDALGVPTDYLVSVLPACLAHAARPSVEDRLGDVCALRLVLGHLWGLLSPKRPYEWAFYAATAFR